MKRDSKMIHVDVMTNSGLTYYATMHIKSKLHYEFLNGKMTQVADKTADDILAEARRRFPTIINDMKLVIQ